MRIVSVFLTLLFAGIGAVALWGAFRLWQNQEANDGSHARAAGTVIALREKSDARRRITYAPVVRFRTADGRNVEFVSSVSGARSPWKVGEEVAVRYDRAKPEGAEIDSTMTRWFPIGGLALLGLIFLYIGLVPSRTKKRDPAEA